MSREESAREENRRMGELMTSSLLKEQRRSPSDCRRAPLRLGVHQCMHVCFNVDIFKGPSEIEEAHAAYISKRQAIENLHYTIGQIAPERMQHMVESGRSVVLDSPFKTYQLCEGSSTMVLLCVGESKNGLASGDLSRFQIRSEVCSSLMSKGHLRSRHWKEMCTKLESLRLKLGTFG